MRAPHRRHLCRLRRVAVAVATTGLAVGLAGTVAGGATSSLPVGTAAQVAAAVAASPHITAVSGPVATWLETYSGTNFDWPWTIYSDGRNGCPSVTTCVYGDKRASAKKTVVLLGDSHAMMWLPAIAPWAAKAKYRVVLLWERACAIAALPKGYTYEGTADSTVLSPAACLSWRTKAVTAIRKMAPALVVIGERTAEVLSGGAGSKPYSEAQWASYLATTITKVRTKSTRVAVIEDVPWHNAPAPSCLAAYATNVQKCSVPYPNGANPGQQVAELSAAQETGAGYIETDHWFCTTDDATCSSVVGNDVTYWDNGHVSTLYAVWLSGVMGTAVQKSL